MRNLKKFLALVLAMIMVMSASAMVSADFTDVAGSNYEEAINDLTVKGIIQGMTETTFGPKQPVNREQMAIFMARVLTGDVDPANTAWKKEAVTPFEDIANFEFQGAIQYAWANGVVAGKTPTTYAPGDGIKYVEALAMAIRALGLDDGKIEWPWGYFNTAVNLGLTEGIEGVAIEQALTREETAQVIYNLVWCDVNGETLASKNFSAQTADNTDLFVITATPKQYHGNNSYLDKTVNDKGVTYVGVQSLVDGIATGAMYYIPAEELGIAADKVEDYFFYSVELINFDEEDGTFGAYIMGDAPKTVPHGSVTVSEGTIKVDGVTYTAIDTYVLSELKNNIAVYDSKYLNQYEAKLLTVRVTDSQSNEITEYVVDIDENRVARKLTVDSNGNTWYYEFSTGKTISYEQAVAKYGIGTGNGLKPASTLTGPYQLDLYDDDRDGLYERAVYVPVYMGVYDVVGTDKYDALASQLLEGKDNYIKAADVTYTDTAAQVEGAISVYTYNYQLNKVTVLDILEPVTGTLTKYTVTNKGKNVTVTVDGVTLPVFSADQTTFATLGANINSRRDPFAPGFSLADNDEYAALGYYKTYNGTGNDSLATLVSRFDTGATVMYYAYNGYILMISEIDRGILDDIAIIETPREFYYDGVYYDIVTGGERVESAHITVLDGKDISGYKTYDWLFAGFLNNSNYHNPGSIYFTRYGVNKGDSYEFGIFLDDYEDFLGNYYGEGPIFQDATLLSDDGSTISFNGDGECIDAQDSTNWLRTDAETVWYFIYTDVDNPMNTKVQIHTGAAYNASIEFDADTWIFADKYKAAADLIIVKDCVKAGIDFVSEGNIVGYLKGNLNVETGTAEEFGLVDKYGDYKGTFYKYPNAKIFDFNSGKWITMDLFSKGEKPIAIDSAYDCYFYVTADGMIITYGDDVLNYVDIVDSASAQYLTKKYNIQNVVLAGGDYGDAIGYDDVMAFINGTADQNIYYEGDGSLTQRGPVPATEEPVSLEGIADIWDLGLTEEVVNAYFDKNGRLIATINVGGGNYMEITADDDVTEIAICGYDMGDVVTGEDALRILNGAHKVSFVNFDDADDDAEIFVNHTAVFWVDYYSINGYVTDCFEQ